MKISQREKTLLLVLLIAALGYLGYTFGYSAYTNYKDSLQSEYDTLKVQYDAVSTAIQMKPVYERDLAATKESIQKLSYGYLDVIDQEKIIVYINKVFADNEVSLNSVSFTPAKVVATGEGNASINEFEYMIAYEGKYQDLKNLVTELQENKFNVVISNINTTVAGDNKLNGSMKLAMYAVDNEYTRAQSMIWSDVSASGVEDPFYYDGKIISTGENRLFDFLMTAKPIVSDYPTVIIQASNDNDGTTNINADSNAIEIARVYFKTEDGKYFYRYEVGVSSYPLDNQWQEFELANDGYINMRIMSTARTTADDAAGVRLIVDNKAGVDVNVYIERDDPNRPRVSVDNMAGVKVYNE